MVHKNLYRIGTSVTAHILFLLFQFKRLFSFSYCPSSIILFHFFFSWPAWFLGLSDVCWVFLRRQYHHVPDADNNITNEFYEFPERSSKDIWYSLHEHQTRWPAAIIYIYRNKIVMHTKQWTLWRAQKNKKYTCFRFVEKK